MRHILIATDGSPSADRAVDLAAAMAKSTGASLKILTIVDRPSREASQKLKEIEHVAESEMPDIVGRATLAHARERAHRAGAGKVQMQALAGDPAEEILGTAMRDNADAIVVGKRGRGKLTGLLLGSVSQKLASLAHCTIIVVP
ncbi:MAG: universal stress protein [Alphaproteobacteria bacterium]|nr:universal stress protein [Alphaproteobacteria bacterium]